ncbi:MAG TPA: hypothetical protein VKP30_30225 [Polyangiaceae bacterium]|nr:hypothetical protein [Polyangiaceae bacterium]
MTAPLLELEDVRIDSGGRCVLEALHLSSSGDRIGLLGQGRPIFDALAGTAEVVSGELRVSGTDLDRARESALFGIARPWSERTSVSLRDGLIASGLLGGCAEAVARQRADQALNLLGMEQMARTKLSGRTRAEHYLAGLAEAALFEPPTVIIDWPIGVLPAEAWVRYGMALARLVQHRRWLAFVPAPARLPVERSWVGALDQLLWIENGLCLELGAGSSERAKTLVVIEGLFDALPEGLEAEATPVQRIRLSRPAADHQTAFVIDLPRDEFGRILTEPVLSWCDRHGLPLFRLDPLDRGF